LTALSPIGDISLMGDIPYFRRNIECLN